MNINELDDKQRYSKAMDFRPNTRVYALSVNKQTNRLTMEFTAQNEFYPTPTKWVKLGNKPSYKIED